MCSQQNRRMNQNRRMKLTVLFIVFYVLVIEHVDSNMCSDEDFEVGFKDSIESMSVRYGHYVELKCCTYDAKKVTWYKWNNTSSMWVTLDQEFDDVIFHHHRQVMSIDSVDFDDNGLYKCTVDRFYVDNTDPENRQFEIEVIPCDVLARGPFPIAPLPCPETSTGLGSLLTLPCTGYFGCGGKDDVRMVTWLVSPVDKEDAWESVSDVDNNRYITQSYNREGYSILGSNLTIRVVESADFNRKFMCVLASPQMINGESRLVVTLKNIGKTDVNIASLSPGKFVVAATIASVFVLLSLVISAIAVYKWYQTKQERQENQHHELNKLTCNNEFYA